MHKKVSKKKGVHPIPMTGPEWGSIIFGVEKDRFTEPTWEKWEDDSGT